MIRLSFETAFRHLRAVTCEYRIFSETGADEFREQAGGPAFAVARRRIYERFADRRTPEGLARAVDRLRAQIAFWAERDGVSQGELRYQRESHRRLARLLDLTKRETESARSQVASTERLLAQMQQRVNESAQESARMEISVSALETERGRLVAENEIVHARLADLFAANEKYFRDTAAMRTEIGRLDGLLAEIYSSRTWKLHLFLDRLRGRR